MQPVEDPILDEIMARLRENSKRVTKDLLSGIGMFALAYRLVFYIAALIGAMLIVFLWTGYYRFNQWYGIGSTVLDILAIGLLLGFSYWFRKQYIILRERYASLFILFDKLGAK